MTNPRWEIPIDTYGIKAQMTPKGLALATHVLAITQSTHWVLNAETTFLRVYAISKDLFFKWATDGEDYATGEDFDEVIPANQVVDLAVPLKSDGTPYTDIQVCGREAGGTVVIIEK